MRSLDVVSVGLGYVPDAPPHWVEGLDDSERTRLEKLRRPTDRAAFAAAHALLRATLGNFLGQPAASLRFAADTGGKPRLVNAGCGRTPSFNLSHADGMVVVALSDGPEVGVDVEPLDRHGIGNDLAAFAFAEAEVEALGRLSGEAWQHAFFRLWTAKEAVAKAVGLGLSLPLAGITVDDGTERATLTGAAAEVARATVPGATVPGATVPVTWALWRRVVASRHVMTAAVAAQGRPDGELAVAWRHMDARGLDALLAGRDDGAAARGIAAAV